MLLTTITTEVVRFDQLKDEYEQCPNFSEIYQVVLQGPLSQYSDFAVHDGFLFKVEKLCIPQTSLREFLIWEIHAGGLGGHFGRNKTILAVEDQFYWPGLKRSIV